MRVTFRPPLRTDYCLVAFHVAFSLFLCGERPRCSKRARVPNKFGRESCALRARIPTAFWWGYVRARNQEIYLCFRSINDGKGTHCETPVFSSFPTVSAKGRPSVALSEDSITFLSILLEPPGAKSSKHSCGLVARRHEFFYHSVLNSGVPAASKLK